MLQALAPVERQEIEAAELTVGVAWLEDADPLVRTRVAEFAERFPRRHVIELPRPEIAALFMREVAGVHQELYAEYGELYGDDVGVKIERCLEVPRCRSRWSRARPLRVPPAARGPDRPIRPIADTNAAGSCPEGRGRRPRASRRSDEQDAALQRARLAGTCSALWHGRGRVPCFRAARRATRRGRTRPRRRRIPRLRDTPVSPPAEDNEQCSRRV